MQISTSITEDVWHDLKVAGSYEWWYFDALSRSEKYSFVAIWYCGFPFSPYYVHRYNRWNSGRRGSPSQPLPLEHTAFSFNLYVEQNEVINFIKESDHNSFAASKTSPEGRFEKNHFAYNAAENCYDLAIDFIMPTKKRKVSARLTFRVMPTSYDVGNLSSGERFHNWVLAAPKCSVTGTLDVTNLSDRTTEHIDFDGSGYHDHNFGTVPMETDIQDWHWGRVHSGAIDLVYYNISYKDASRQPFRFLMFSENDKLLFSSNQLGSTTRNYSRKLWLRYPERLTMTGSDLQFEAHQLNVLDNGPFYMRFLSEYKLVFGGKHYNFKGISEFLRPERITSSIVQNLVKTRVWREGSWSAMFQIQNFLNKIFQ
jgi:carotenoid 1,2-hydratase